MKLYCYSEVSHKVEESEAVSSTSPNMLGNDVRQVTMHGTVETADLSWLTGVGRWADTPRKALEKYIEKEKAQVTDHQAKLDIAKGLLKNYE